MVITGPEMDGVKMREKPWKKYTLQGFNIAMEQVRCIFRDFLHYIILLDKAAFQCHFGLPVGNLYPLYVTLQIGRAHV